MIIEDACKKEGILSLVRTKKDSVQEKGDEVNEQEKQTKTKEAQAKMNVYGWEVSREWFVDTAPGGFRGSINNLYLGDTSSVGRFWLS